jgi:hypothetical protein
MMPFISRYKLSNSTLLGFGSAELAYMVTPSTSTGCKIDIKKIIIRLFTKKSEKVL